MRRSKARSERASARIRRILQRQSVSEICVSPGYQTHEQLWQIASKLPTDFEPYGQVKRETICDCSCGCRWFHVLAGRQGRDWGVCANQQSPRAGLLTFEHQGCLQFEEDLRTAYLETANGRNARQLFEELEEELRKWRRSHPYSGSRATRKAAKE
jgi:hypothetical protein